MKNLTKYLVVIFLVMASIIATGLLLDEASKGKLGAWIKGLAIKATAGYGSLNA